MKVTDSTQNLSWEKWVYRIGCPVWGCNAWTGQIYPVKTHADDYLEWYSRMFPTVEGNSTFYGVPSHATFQKWRDNSEPNFQFCFKFPRTISHELKLSHCSVELRDWLKCLAILRDGGRLGPTFLQLPPSFSFGYFDQLNDFLHQLPMDWMWSLEMRHLDWFDNADCESRLNDLLESLNIDRVLFDSSPLNSLQASDVTEQASQSRKPKSPFRNTVTGHRPMLRLIGRNDAKEISMHWEKWSIQIAEWIRAGLQPWIFTHAPDDTYAPQLARLLHEMVRIQLPQLPELPQLKPPNDLKQLLLF
jgi:uncharacterized protein YecE (DUF72 family)